MTYEDFLTLTLPDRIKWLRSPEGPAGELSHDRLGKALGTSRQVVIGWEKDAGPEPAPRFRDALAKFSGFPAAAFSRRLSERPAADSLGRRLEELADLVGRGFLALGVTPDQLRPSGEARLRRDPQADTPPR